MKRFGSKRNLAVFPPDWGLEGLPARFRRGETSPSGVLYDCLSRIQQHNHAVGAIQALDELSARESAAKSTRRWRKEEPLSGLDGVPIAVKANISVCGLPWNAGILAYAERIGVADASCVASMRSAGAVILGTTSMDEGALGAIGDNPSFGRTINPLRPGFTAGGSSGGSAAAVAAGFCAAALGTDTIGSVRIPAAYCGIFGHKPGRGWTATDGVTPLSTTFDTLGILARSAKDCLLLTNIIGGGVANNANRTSIIRRIALLDWCGAVAVAPDVVAALERAADKARRSGIRVERKQLDGYDYVRIQRRLLMIAEVEGAKIHEHALLNSPEGFSAGLRRMFQWGRAQSQQKYADALRDLQLAANIVANTLSGFDALLCPATPDTAFRFDTETPDHQAIFMTPAVCAGFPATAFPAGASRKGLPISLQIIARQDVACLTLAGMLSEPRTSH